MKRIVCFHLLNDFSGSPHVLSTVLDVLVQKGYDVRLSTSATTGFLSSTPVVTDTTIYRWQERRLLQILFFAMAQCQLFFTSLFRYGKYDVFYINTLLPFGAAVAGRLTGKEVICHIHEKYVTPNLMQRLAYWVIKHTATRVLFVSRYLREQYPDIPPRKGTVIYNALPSSFTIIADRYLSYFAGDRPDVPAVLMIGSYKEYKGIYQFTALAARLPHYRFLLVMNTSPKEAARFRKQYCLPNLFVYPSQADVHPFYQQVALVLNLSLPGQWVETFGLTLLEGMRYGLPVIAPPVGGPAELVEDGVNGFLADARDLPDVQQKIVRILENNELYTRFSHASLIASRKFDLSVMTAQLTAIIDEKD